MEGVSKLVTHVLILRLWLAVSVSEHTYSTNMILWGFQQFKGAWVCYRNDGEYQTRSAYQNKMKTRSGKTKAFSYSRSVKEWCALIEEIWNIVSVNKFKEITTGFIRPKENSVFAIHDTKSIKLLTRLRLKTLAIYMNINLDMALKIRLILFANAV